MADISNAETVLERVANESLACLDEEHPSHQNIMRADIVDIYMIVSKAWMRHTSSQAWTLFMLKEKLWRYRPQLALHLSRLWSGRVSAH